MKHLFFVITYWIVLVPAIAVSYSGSFGLSDLQFSTGERGYDTITMNDLETSRVVGAPQVPVRMMNFIIPTGMDVDDVLINVNSQTLSETYDLLPVQPPILTSEDWQPGPFIEPDSTYYNMPIYPPSVYEVINHGYFDGNARIATIAIYPIQYMPQSHQVLLNTSINFSLSFQSSSQVPVFPVKRKSLLQEKYNSLLYSIVENPEDIQMYYSQPPSTELLPTEADYVIVAPEELIPSLCDFMTWKAAKGLNIHIKSKEEIFTEYPNGDQVDPDGLGIDDDAGRIRQYLFEQYSQHGLVYALLVGDHTVMPVRYGQPYNNDPPLDIGFPTDLYYSDLNGNWNVDGNGYYGQPTDSVDVYSEIFVGRVLVPLLSNNGGQHIENWTEKLITYESNPGYGEDTYLTNAVYAVADQGMYTDSYPGDQITLLSGHGFQVTPMDEYPPDGVLGAPTGAQVINQINEGAGIVSFYTHGSVTTTAVSSTDVNEYPKHWVTSLDEYNTSHSAGIIENGNGFDNLNTNGKYSVNYSISCDVSAYDLEFDGQDDEGYCMARTFTSLLEGKGGPAFLGNTRIGSFVNSRLLHSEFLNILFQVQNPYGQYNCTNAGIAEAGSKILHLARVQSYSHNLFGDPEMPIWTEQPNHFVMSYNTQNNSIHIVNAETSTAVPNAIVHFWNANASQSELKETDSNGNAVCSFSYTDVCVTKVNHIPSIKHIVPAGGEIWTNNQELKYDVVIPSGRSLTILADANLSMLSKNRNARIIVEDGASLYIDNATITGMAASSDQIKGNAIIVHGDFSIGNNVSFSSIGDSNWDGLYLDNPSLNTISNATFSRCNLKKLNGDIVVNGSSFNNAKFISNDATVTINNSCTFTNCDLNIEYGSLTAVNSSFVNSAINCNRTIVSIVDCPTLGGVYCNGSEFVEIRNNTENTYNITGMYDGVTLINCGVTNIYGYTITGNVRNGINLHESYGSNTIENCSIISNSQDGIRMYHSSARVIGCQISGNQKGVIAYRGSNVEILKDPNSAPWFHDSCITNNTWMEVLFTDDCDLQMAHGMNKILDAPYNPDTFDKYLVFCPNMTRSRDLGVNYWGSDPQGMPIYPAEERFEPACIDPNGFEIGFNLDPLWNPGPPSIITWENDELIYHNAIDLALAEDTAGAVALFKDLISQYPGSDFAPAAAKNLLALEEDKQALKDYYATEPNLHWNGEIDKLTDYLENYCNIKMGDYQAAISWFEDIISDPDCELDSLMAVIDLGYVYLLMQENSPKAQITCQYPQLVPKSRTQYEQKTNAILSAL